MKESSITQRKEPPDVRQKTRQVPVYLPLDLDRRLSRYQFEKFDGKMHVRAGIIRQAIDRFLIAEGY
jgi:hypothetical protein